MQITEYIRNFVLQASHFNNAEVYEVYSEAFAAKEKGLLGEAFIKMQEVLTKTHGHNFEVKVKVLAQDFKITKGTPYFIKDEDLSELIGGFDNTCLSILPEFLNRGVRATTEEMCVVFKEKVETLVSTTVPGIVCAVEVSVRETSLILALARAR